MPLTAVVECDPPPIVEGPNQEFQAARAKAPFFSGHGARCSGQK
jgi:hypothetical protein